MTLKDHLKSGTDFGAVLSLDFTLYQQILERVYVRSFGYVTLHLQAVLERVRAVPEGIQIEACLLPDDLPLIVAEIVEEEVPHWNLVQQTVLYTLVMASCVDNATPEYQAMFEPPESIDPKFKMN